MSNKKCIVCEELKDLWLDFTMTNSDGSHYESDVCQMCRFKAMGEPRIK